MNGLGKRKQSSKGKKKVSSGALNDSGENSDVLITQVKNTKKVVQEDPELKKKEEEEKKSMMNSKSK
jgi:hypothetical protein